MFSTIDGNNLDDVKKICETNGGGWVLGNADTHYWLVSSLADKAKCAIIFVAYTLSPDAQFSYSSGSGNEMFNIF